MTAFEFGPGPITWAYMSEVCNDKGTSAATSVNWLATLIVTIVGPILINNCPFYEYVIYAAFSAVAVVFTALCVKETKGLSDAEAKRLYRTDADVIAAFEKKQKHYSYEDDE